MKTLSEFKKERENPFIEELLDLKINSRRRIIAGKGSNYVVDKEGEVVGSQVFAVVEKVDREKFTKIFNAGLSGMFELSNKGVKLFSYIASIVKPNQTFIYFDIEKCKEFTKYKTNKSVYGGIAELVKAKFIARTDKNWKYFINPNMFFNGDRVAFIKMYELEKKKEQKDVTLSNDPNQIKGQTMLDM